MGILLQSIKRIETGQTGTVAYLYRPETNNPARMYVMIDWDQWKKAKTVPIGLVDQVPLSVRVMTHKERNLYKDYKFLTFHTFENWHELITRDIIMNVPEHFIKDLRRYSKNEHLKLQEYVAEFS